MPSLPCPRTWSFSRSAKVSVEVESDGVGRERKFCEELSSTDTDTDSDTGSEGKVVAKVDLLLHNKVMETRKEERKEWKRNHKILVAGVGVI